MRVELQTVCTQNTSQTNADQMRLKAEVVVFFFNAIALFCFSEFSVKLNEDQKSGEEEILARWEKKEIVHLILNMLSRER